MTTPENTDEVLCILSTIKLEYDLGCRGSEREVCQVKSYITSEPLQKKYVKQGPQIVHAKILKLEPTFQAIPFPQSARTQGEEK